MTEAERRGLEAQHFRARQAKSEQLTKASLKAQAEQAKKTFFDDALTVGDRKELAWLTDSTYFDENGNEKTVTVQQKRDAAISGMMEREQRWLQTAPGKPEEKAETSFNRTVEWLSENGAKHPQWEAQLKAGSMALNTVMSGGQIPENAKRGFELYRRLVAKAPQLVHAMTDEGARTQYEVARTLVESGERSEDEALTVAVEYNRDPSRFDSTTARQRLDEVKEALSNFEGGVFSGFGTIHNPETISWEMQKLADVYIRAGGLSADKALDKAKEAAKRNFTNVNGWAVRTGDRSVPPNFGELATMFIKKWASENGERFNVDASELSIRPLPNSSNNWVIINSLGLLLETGPSSVLTTDDLYEAKRFLREQEEARLVKESEDRYKPLVVLPGLGLTIGRPKLDGYSDDEARQFKDESDRALMRGRTKLFER